MREREVLAIAKDLGIYDKSLGFVEISPQELIEFAGEIEERVTEQLLQKMHTLVEKLA